MAIDRSLLGPEGTASAKWVAALLQASDSLYPTGSYAHSFGLEGLVQDGQVRDAESLRTFLLRQALPALGRTDLAVAARAWPATVEPVDWDEVGRLCILANAMRGARELREASAAIGRQRCELAARLRGGIAAEFQSRALRSGWPQPACMAAIIEARAIGAPLEAALTAQIYSAAGAMLASAVKLLRLGQNTVQVLLTECLEAAPSLIDAAQDLRSEDFGAFNPWWDLAAARHETADFRLFIS